MTQTLSRFLVLMFIMATLYPTTGHTIEDKSFSKFNKSKLRKVKPDWMKTYEAYSKDGELLDDGWYGGIDDKDIGCDTEGATSTIRRDMPVTILGQKYWCKVDCEIECKKFGETYMWSENADTCKPATENGSMICRPASSDPSGQPSPLEIIGEDGGGFNGE